MSARICLALAAALLLVSSRAAAAQLFFVSSGNGGTMTVTTAIPGLQPTPVSSSTTTYVLVTIGGTGATRLRAAVDVPLPPGVTLSVTLPSPGGGIVSTGPVALTTTPQNLLTNLPDATMVFPNMPITYVLSATAAAGIVPSTTYTVTFSFQ